MEYIKSKLVELGWTDEFKSILKHNHVHYKEDTESDLVILFNNYSDLYQSKVNQYMRSVVVSRDKKEIVNFSCATPYANLDGLDYMCRHNEDKYEITECYEGTYVSLFCYEDKWYMSTRKCLDAKESKYKEQSYYDMFCDVIKQDDYSFESFCDKLDKSLSYNFILLDSRNVNIVDYSYLYGNDYKKLMFVESRDKDMKRVESEFGEFGMYSENILGVKKIDHISYLDRYNELNKWSVPAKSEGIILRYENDVLIKFNSLDYKFAKSIGSDENMYLGLLKMYQLDKLVEYIEHNGNKEKFEKMVNPNNTTESFHTVGIVNSVFRTLTTELFSLYNILYKKDGTPDDKLFYKVVPKEYKYFMFKIRGINFKKNNYGKEVSEKDVYYLLKNTDIEKISELLRARKLMNNLVYSNKFNENMKKFRGISKNVDKLNFKLIGIFTSKIYPELMDKDYPEGIVLE